MQHDSCDYVSNGLFFSFKRAVGLSFIIIIVMLSETILNVKGFG